MQNFEIFCNKFAFKLKLLQLCMVYLTLFFVAFLSGSLLPLGSEALFIYVLKNGHIAWVVWLVASFGNILGAVFNYYLGFRGERYLLNKEYVNKSSLNRAKGWFGRFGGYSLLLSAAPIIGDPLTFIAGVLEYSFWRFLLFVSLSKSLRYAIIAIPFIN